MANDKKMQYKSGIEEEVNELDDILQQIADLMNEYSKIQSVSSYEKGSLQREKESAIATYSVTNDEEDVEENILTIEYTCK
ncbi:hypothetical protein HHI36_016358 [Cryptolaemus montrouzieri]|uniref:Uncharacterized protein n=1 Tax=Cryptolaemus montrouzieri TaxID=559131 RepID=A0ABD2NJ90_9CUCU